LDNAVKLKYINVVGKHIFATFRALRRLHGIIMVISVDESEHVEYPEGIVESATSDWLAGLNWNIEDLEAYRIVSN
jgi:hypothetical protein